MPNSEVQSTFLRKVREILPADSLLTSQEDCAAYGTDWSKIPGHPCAVALPRSTEEVAKLLTLCDQYSFPVVPSGGRTGLVAGAAALSGELVLSLSRMNRVFPVDTLSATVRVQAGATTQSVHEHCAPHGLTWPIDLAAKGTSQVGGNLSTNAGGVRVIRYGMTRKWVLGLEIVTAQGKVIQLNRSLEKNNTGYDLMQLLIGSEGTLAVLTEATLKLTRLPKETLVLFFAIADLRALFALLDEVRQAPFEPLAFEFFSAKCLQAVETILKRSSKLSQKTPYYALVEAELHSAEDREKVEIWVDERLDKGLWVDGCIASAHQEKAGIWALREGITESLSRTGRVRKYDVAVPVSRLPEFLSAAEKTFTDLKLPLQLYLFGHLGDGSPHLNLVDPTSLPVAEFEAYADKFERLLFPLLKSLDGSVSAEHGVGLLKKSWVTYSRSAEEVAWFRAIKTAFDPKGILNPGKIVDVTSSAASSKR